MTATISSVDFVNLFETSEYAYASSLSFSSGSSSESLPAIDPIVAYDNGKSDIQVEISGVSFLVSDFAFQQLSRLPWERIHATAYRLEGTSADTFEKILDYVLFRTLPKHKRMTRAEQEELLAMARTLRLSELVTHMQSSKQSRSPKKSLGVLFGCRSCKSSDVETAYGYRQNRTNTFTTY